MKSVQRRTIVVSAGMLVAAMLAEAGKPVSKAPGANPAPRLDELFPARFGSWQTDPVASAFIRPPDEQGKLYGIYDQVLERRYFDTAANGRSVMLSVAFGSEQSAGIQMHRPEVCYRFGGFKVSSTQASEIHMAGQPVPVVTLHAQQGLRSEPITYWTVLGDTVINDRLSFRLAQLRFGLKRQVLDGMLVRLSSIEDDLPRAFALHARFADKLIRAVSPVYRSRLIGAAPETARVASTR